MGERLLFENSMEDTLEALLRDREKKLLDINQELQHLRGGTIHIRKKHGRIFLGEYSNGREKGITGDEERIYRLARRAYLEKAAKQLKKECSWIRKSIEMFQKNGFKELDQEFLRRFHFLDLRRICWQRKKYEWATAPYSKNTLFPEDLKYATDQGVKMRSKSERTIGNRLEFYEVAYRYDAVLELDLGVVSPDFTIMKPDWTLAAWEHFGKEGDLKYDKKNERKLEIYYDAGFRENRNLIITRESDLETPEILDDIITRFLLH